MLISEIIVLSLVAVIICLGIYNTFSRICFGKPGYLSDFIDLVSITAISPFLLAAVICILFDLSNNVSNAIYFGLGGTTLGIFSIFRGKKHQNKFDRIFLIVFGICLILYGVVKSLYLIY